MKLFGKLAVLGSLALTAGLLAPMPQALASTSIGISVGFGPPAPLYAPIPAARVDYVWASGYWRWDGYRYIWMRGRWYPRRPGYVYERPRWEHSGDRWVFHGARWHPYRHHVYRQRVYRHRVRHDGYHDDRQRSRYHVRYRDDARRDRDQGRQHERSHHDMRYGPVDGHAWHGNVRERSHEKGRAHGHDRGGHMHRDGDTHGH